MQTLKRMPLAAVEKFVSDNAGECADIAEGVLLDNVVYEFSFGTLFCFENYATEWSSNYTCLFYHRERARGINKAWERFENLKKSCLTMAN